MTATEQIKQKAIQALRDKAEALKWNQSAWDPTQMFAKDEPGLTRDDYALIVELCEAAR